MLHNIYVAMQLNDFYCTYFNISFYKYFNKIEYVVIFYETCYTTDRVLWMSEVYDPQM